MPFTSKNAASSFWTAASWPVGPHCVGEKFRGRGLGSRLLTALCDESEKEGYWTLHSTVLQDNTASLGLHTKCGFRVVGRRERIARDCHGRWLDTYLMERRAKADEPAGYKKL